MRMYVMLQQQVDVCRLSTVLEVDNNIYVFYATWDWNPQHFLSTEEN